MTAKTLFFAAAFSGCLHPPQVAALNPDRKISQYAHTAWRIQDGFFAGSPYSITQTVDGFIWIGTTSGIVRFDGVRFVSWNPPGGERLRESKIWSLLGSDDGGLWIGTDRNGLWNWDKRQLINYQVPGWVLAINEIRVGGRSSVWAAFPRLRAEPGGICEVSTGRLKCFGEPEGFSESCCQSLAIDSSGLFWIGTDTGVVKWKPYSTTAEVTNLSDEKALQEGVLGIAITKDGSTWIGSRAPSLGGGLTHLVQGHWVPLIVANWNSAKVAVNTLFRDRHDALWIGSADQGLYRILSGRVDHFGSSEGLSDDFVTKIMEDREGNLWVTTLKGVDCFRDLAVTTFSSKEGLSAMTTDTVMASRNGTVWAGGEKGLDAMLPEGISSIRTGRGLPGIQVGSLFEDHGGRMWVGVDRIMSTLKNGRFTEVKRPDGRSLGNVVGIAEDIDNNIWAEISATPRELVRIRNLRVERVFSSQEIPPARKVAADPDGGIWLGLMSGDLARYRAGKLEVFRFHHETDSMVYQINVNQDHSVLGATAFGLIGWRAGKQQVLTARNGLPCNGINSFVWDGAGALWLYTQCGLIEIAAQEVQRWWANESTVLKTEVFDALDGVQAGIAWYQASTRSNDGKLWFANTSALQMIDPMHLPVNTIPPPVHVEEVTVKGRTFPPTDGMRLAALTRDISIRYTALSFVAPQKVRFRYMLEGQDKTWQDAGTRREAFYTNLAPASYRFHVIACNNSGLWNEAGATWSFQIEPAYYQTAWFKLLGVGVGLGLCWSLYLLRLAQATAQIQARLGERLRIARELHDTLLQGFSGLVLRFAAAAKALPPSEPARDLMEKALDRADEVLLEGRLRVRNLRLEPASPKDLTESLSDCGEELAQDSGVAFKLTVVGESLPLDPAASDDMYRIGREALTNAFSHARASGIEVEITYSRANVRLRVRDNGIGIAPNVLNEGRPGHWGLLGVRERAEQIGATLNIWSSAGAGTEIDLTIPARVAYPRGPRVRGWFRFQRIFAGGKAKGKRSDAD